jgi:hypothetical protein
LKLLHPVTEAEMVAVFLKAEIDAARYGEELLRLLARDGLDRSLLDSPNVGDEEEDRHRARLLGEARGYGRNEDVFTGTPDDVEWFRAELEPTDLDALMYIDYDYWTGFTGGTRRAKDAARRIMAGETFSEETSHFGDLAESVSMGMRFPEAIMLHNPESGELVILEGHKRMTAYLMLPEPLPRELLQVIAGVSAKIKK